MNAPAPRQPTDIVAIVLAAGNSSRLGSPKQLAVDGRESLLRHTLGAALGSGVQHTLVVLGAHGQELARHVQDLPVQIVHHPRWHEGLSSSLRAGLEAVADRAAAVLFLVSDQVALSPELLQQLLERWRGAPHSIVACAYGGTVGVPALFPRNFFDELRELRGDTGARSLLALHRDQVLTVPFPEGTADLDAPAEAIKAVIFDFGNVICSFDPARLIANLVRLTGKSPEELTAGVRSSMETIMDFERGLLTTEEFLSRITREAGVQLSEDEFRRAYCDIFTPIAETIELIRKLKGRYRLGLLSNTNAIHFECAIRPVEVFQCFDAVTLSFEVKAMKPARKIYDDALAKIGLPATQCVYIDDLQENIEAAARLGFRAIHYTSPQALLAELRHAGVRIDHASSPHRGTS